MANADVLLVYDQECPACNAYCQLVRVRQSVGPLVLVNARESSEVMDQITSQGLDIDQGMVLRVGGSIFYGADAIQALALLGTRAGFFNRMNYWLFRFRPVARVLYPPLRAMRNLLLKVLRVSKINNLGLDHNDRF